MLNIVILGAPGSGKGTQSDLMIKEFGLEHISTGDIMRAEIKNGTELGKIAATYINRGQLVPDELTINSLSNVLDHLGNPKGVIFDGFPRTVKQAEALKGMLNNRGEDVSGAIELKVDEDELVKRLLERGKLSGRPDDNRETILQRLDVYHSQTIPVAGYYTGEGKHYPIRGTGTVEEIFERIKKVCQTL